MAKSYKGISDDLRKAMEEYGADVLKEAEKVSVQTAENIVRQLRTTNQPPASSSGSAQPRKRRMWKQYAASWDFQATRYPVSSAFKVIVYNKRHYQLTHLLEKGHRTRNGTTTRAFKHIEPIANRELDDYVKKLEKSI